MRVLLSWLKEYVDLPFGVGELEERLPMLGLGIDGVERFGDDAVFDLEVAANRPDLMSIVGVARELAAAARTTVRMPSVELTEAPSPAAELAQVEVVDPDLCPRYTAHVIVNVTVGPSPAWMAGRLEACGIRSINNVVDVTNYVMLELGQPMHAFDYDGLHGGRIIVRRATRGEPLFTLDGVERTLDPQTLVIADADRAIGVGGIIGGADTEIGPSTTRVLLEAAVFQPAAIRRSSKRLGVRTESSARFERGVDGPGVSAATARAVSLMQQLGGGRVLRGAIDTSPAVAKLRAVGLRWPSVARLLGMEIPQDEGIAILRSLGFAVEHADGVLRVTVPSFRRDVEREEDLIEEVARHYGYERIPQTMPVEVTAQGSVAPAVVADQAVRDALVRAGMTEALTLSLTNPATLDSLRLPPDHPWRRAVRLTNPMVEDHVQLRTTLLPGLLHVARANASHRVTDMRVFELGRTFHSEDGRVVERRRLGVLLMGRVMEGAWNVPAEAVDSTYYHLKGVVEALLHELRIAGATFAPSPSPWLHPGRAAVLMLDGKIAGSLGEVHPEVGASYDLPHPAFVADLDVEALLARAVLRPQFVPLPRFPSVRRDISLVVPAAVAAGQVEEVIRAAGGNLLDGADVFDVYAGPPVPAGHKNLAYALTFRSPDRTLTAEEVAGAVTAITLALTQRLRAKIRE